MASETMKTVAEQIADWLVRQGVERVFSVTGGGAMFLNQAFGSHPELRCTYMHHEQACAMAAEGYARVSGRPAVVNPTTGPGSINALNGVFGAYTDSIPMLVISGQVKRETCLEYNPVPRLRQLGDQEGPTVALASAVCKYARSVGTPRDLETMLPEAFAQAVSGRPGPVWLDVPLDVQGAKEQLDIPDFSSPPRIVPAGLQDQCREIVRRLATAHRPVILGGTGVRLAGAVERVLRLVESLGIPYATAWTHDLIPSDHPLFAGRPGTIGTRAGNLALQNADFVLVLGSRLNIRQTSYNFESFARNAWVVQIDVDPAELVKPTVRPDLGVAVDLRDFLDALETELSRAALPDFGEWARWCGNVRTAYGVRREHVQRAEGLLNPYVVVARVFDLLRDDDIVVCGNASACILPFQVGDLRKAQRMFSNSGSASMGYDLPAALGAAEAAVGRRVICVAGDGSLQMNIQELQTLASGSHDVVIVLLNNGGYLSIWQTHENFFGRVVGATPASGVDFPDFVAVAHAYGIDAERVVTRQDLSRLDELLGRNGPLLIDIVVDPRQEFSPRIKSRQDPNGAFVTPELDDMHPFLEPAKLEELRVSARSVRSGPRRAIHLPASV